MSEESTSPLNTVKESILKNLRKNGFPNQAVSFPMDSLYEFSQEKGISLNTVRDEFTKEGILSDLEGERIIFKMQEKVEDASDFNLENLKGHPMYEQAKSLLGQANPSDLAKLQKLASTLGGGGASLSEMQAKLSNLSPEERNDVMDLFQKLNPMK